MVFYKKKMQRLAAQNEIDFAEVTGAFQQRLTEIGSIPDAGRCYLALVELEESIVEEKEAAYLKIGKQIRNSTSLFHISDFAVFSLEVLMSRREENILWASRENFLNSMNDLAVAAIAKKSALVENDLLTLSKSECFGDICDKCPDISAAFAKMAARTGLDIPRVVRLDKPGPQRPAT